MKKNIRKNSIAILSVLEVAVLTFIYYMIWRIGYTHGIPGYPEYYGMGRFVLVGVYMALLGILIHLAGGFRFGRKRALSIVLCQWAMILAANVFTYFQLSLTAKELVAKRPMLDITLAQFFAVFVFIAMVRVIRNRMHISNSMLLIGRGVDTGTMVDGYRVTEAWDEKEIKDKIGSISGFDAVLIHGLEEREMYEVLQICIASGSPTYLAREKELIHGVSRGVTDKGLNCILVKNVGEGWIDGVLDVARGYLV